MGLSAAIEGLPWTGPAVRCEKPVSRPACITCRVQVISSWQADAWLGCQSRRAMAPSGTVLAAPRDGRGHADADANADVTADICLSCYVPRLDPIRMHHACVHKRSAISASGRRKERAAAPWQPRSNASVESSTQWRAMSGSSTAMSSSTSSPFLRPSKWMRCLDARTRCASNP